MATYANSKSQKSATHSKHHITESAYEKFFTQQDALQPSSKNSSHSKIKSIHRQTLSVITSNPFINKHHLNQSFTCAGTSSSSGLKTHSRSKSNIKLKHGKTNQALNDSQTLLSTPEVSISYSRLPKKKSSTASLNKTFQDAFTLIGNSELEMSIPEINLSKYGHKTEFLDLDTSKFEETTKMNSTLSTCDNIIASLENECDKRVKEIIKKYQMREAMYKQELSHLKQSNGILQTHIKTLESELLRCKKKREKDAEYTRNLESQLRKLQENEKTRDREHTETLEQLFTQETVFRLQKDGFGSQLNAYSQLTLNIETLTTEKKALENLLKKALQKINEKSTQQHEQASNGELQNDEMSFQTPNKVGTPLQAKNMNIAATLGPDENQTSQQYAYGKKYPQIEALHMSGSSSKHKFQNTEKDFALMAMDSIATKENRPSEGQKSGDSKKVVIPVLNLSTENLHGNVAVAKAKKRDASPGETAFHPTVENQLELDSELESCSGRLSPKQIMLRNYKYPENMNREKSPNKYDVSRLKLDLSKIHLKKNF